MYRPQYGNPFTQAFQQGGMQRPQYSPMGSYGRTGAMMGASAGGSSQGGGFPVQTPPPDNSQPPGTVPPGGWGGGSGGGGGGGGGASSAPFVPGTNGRNPYAPEMPFYGMGMSPDQEANYRAGRGYRMIGQHTQQGNALDWDMGRSLLGNFDRGGTDIWNPEYLQYIARYVQGNPTATHTLPRELQFLGNAPVVTGRDKRGVGNSANWQWYQDAAANRGVQG